MSPSLVCFICPTAVRKKVARVPLGRGLNDQLVTCCIGNLTFLWERYILWTSGQVFSSVIIWRALSGSINFPCKPYYKNLNKNTQERRNTFKGPVLILLWSGFFWRRKAGLRQIENAILWHVIYWDWVSRDRLQLSWQKWIVLGRKKTFYWFWIFKMLLWWAIAFAIFPAVRVKACCTYDTYWKLL